MHEHSVSHHKARCQRHKSWDFSMVFLLRLSLKFHEKFQINESSCFSYISHIQLDLPHFEAIYGWNTHTIAPEDKHQTMWMKIRNFPVDFHLNWNGPIVSAYSVTPLVVIHLELLSNAPAIPLGHSGLKINQRDISIQSSYRFAPAREQRVHAEWACL